MTWQPAPGLIYLPDPFTGSASLTGTLVGSATARTGYVLQVPVTGVLTHVFLRTGNNTTSGVPMRVRVETIDAAGVSTGTLVGGDCQASFVPVANTSYEVALNQSLNVTRGQWLSVVCDMPGWTAGALNMAILTVQAPAVGIPYGVIATTGTLSKTGTLQWTSGFKIDGNWVAIPRIYPVSNASSTAFFTSDATANDRGNRFILPSAYRIAGIWHVSNQPGATARTYQIYDMANTIVGQIAVAGYGPPASVNGLEHYLFDNDVILDAGFEGRVTVKPTGAATVTDRTIDAPSSAYAEAMPGGANWQRTVRKNAGAWTDQPASRMAIGLLANAIGTSNRKVMTAGGLVPA